MAIVDAHFHVFAKNDVKCRLIYGSDFPIPTNDFSAGRLGFRIDRKLAAKARKTKNLLDKDVLAKRAVGVPKEVMHRTAELLRIQ